MRKLKRSIARARMERLGVLHINKKRRDRKGHALPSYFADNWRKFYKNNI